MSKTKSGKIRLSRAAIVWIIAGLFVVVVYFVQRVEESGDRIIEFTQDGQVVESDFKDTGQLKQIETINEEEPTECLEPKASSIIDGPVDWETSENVVNNDNSNYNYVRFRSPDYRFGTSVEGRRGIVEGGEITFIVNCDSDFSSIEELVKYETEERIFKNSSQIPLYLRVDGVPAVQYYFSSTSHPPLVTVMYKDGNKYTLQYGFPVYQGNNQQVIDSIETVKSDYLVIYVEMLNSINLPK